MRTFALWIGVFLISASVAFAAESEDGFVSLFDGTTLDGWSGQPGIWSVRDGAIVGESTPEKPNKKTNYISSAAKIPDNFHFKVTFRMQGDGSNSGVQFRSEQKPDFDVFGYQADVDDSGQWTGCLFHTTRGAVVRRGYFDVTNTSGKAVSSRKVGDTNELIKSYKKGDWNDYEIIADGSVISLFINGQLMCVVDDKDEKLAAKSGILALQMHQGKPMKVEFKNIKIKAL